MRDMQMDKTELGCLRAIVLFNPGNEQLVCDGEAGLSRAAAALPLSFRRAAPSSTRWGREDTNVVVLSL